jgi:hypothetical protein
MSQDSEFWKQFSGSATANIVLVIAYGLYKFIESHCKHSRCSSKNSCFNCSVDNDKTIRGLEVKDALQFGEDMQKLQPRNQEKIQERHNEIV